MFRLAMMLHYNEHKGYIISSCSRVTCLKLFFIYFTIFFRVFWYYDTYLTDCSRGCGRT